MRNPVWKSDGDHEPHEFTYWIFSDLPSFSGLRRGEAEGCSSFLSALLKRLFSLTTAYNAISLFFEGTNDIAVSVDSAKLVPDDRLPDTRIEEVACNHLAYFHHPAAEQPLKDALS